MKGLKVSDGTLEVGLKHIRVTDMETIELTFASRVGARTLFVFI